MDGFNEVDDMTSEPEKKNKFKLFLNFVIPILILIVGLIIAKYFMDTRPKAKRRTPSKQARLVTIELAKFTKYSTKIDVMGTVKAAKVTTINPRVSGEIIHMSSELIPGGVIKNGQVLMQIDSSDYETIVKQRESEFANAELNLKLEIGNQAVAKEEYEMLKENIDEDDMDLVLRKPYLEKARALFESAKASLEKAKLDVKRCTIEAPYNSIIVKKHVDIGTIVSSSTPLFTLIGTDEYWIEVLVPLNQLKWIEIPKSDDIQGSSVKVFNHYGWGEKVYRVGKVIRLLGELEEKGRMAQLLISLKNPLGLGDSNIPELLINSYVQVVIEGKEIESVIPLKREFVHMGNEVWIMNDNDELEIHKVEILFKDRDMVFINIGIQEGDRIVTSDISAPVNGMVLRLNGSTADIIQEAIN